MRTNRILNLTNSLRLGLCLAAWSAPRGIAQVPAPWETVLDYQFPAGTAGGGGIATDDVGNVFSGGNVSDAAGITRGMVLQSDTSQAAWSISDDTNPDPAQYESFVWDLGHDANGNLYSVGQLTSPVAGIAYWYVRKRARGSADWLTMEAYQYVAGRWIDATGFATDDAGGVYVVGWARDAGSKRNSQGNLHWLVCRSTDAGENWTVVDDVMGPTSNFGAAGASFVPGVGLFVVGAPYSGPSSPWMVRRSLTGTVGSWSTVDNPFSGAAQAVGSDSQGNIYVVGAKSITGATKPKATGYSAWVTRRSTDGGNTWMTVDTFNYAANTDASAYGIGRDSTGNVVVVGRGADAQGKLYWLVRIPDASGAWQTVDAFRLATGYHASALGVATDAAGNLLVAGFAYDGAGSHWVVRRRSAGNP